MPKIPNLLEQTFINAAGATDLRLEYDVQLGRYRVDFAVAGAPVVIELDGHGTHALRDQRRADAVRERYIEREGFTVVRFTSDEIFSDATQCVEEVRQLLRARSTWAAKTAIYIDWLFLDRQYPDVRKFYQRLHPTKQLASVTLSRVLRALILWLDVKENVDVYLYGIPSSFSQSLITLDVIKFLDCQQASFRVVELQGEFAACELVEVLRQTEPSYNSYILIADDAAYPPLLGTGRLPCALIRRDNENTAMIGLPEVKWQDVAYILGSALGLRRDPMEL